MERAVLIMGPPGSGKSTQAEMVSKEYDLVHLNAGDFLKDLIDKGKLIDTNYVAGQLVDSRIVLDVVKEEVKRIKAEGGNGIVFSGSPRTALEAYGDEERQGLIDFLKELYPDNVYFFRLVIPYDMGEKRNLGRDTLRIIDDPERAKIRTKAYKDSTEPIFDTIHEKNIKFFEIDGTPLPDKVFESIKSHLDA